MIADEDIEPFASSPDDPFLPSDHLDPPDPDLDLDLIPQISLHAMDGTAMPNTFRMHDFFHQHRLIILVDGGCTHNFIQSCVAYFLHLPVSPSNTLRIMVGDDNTLDCTTTSQQVPLYIQGHTFVTDLFHLPISGIDIVLGIQWLKQLGPITKNHKGLAMSFFLLGQPTTLIMNVSMDPVSISAQQLKRYAQTHSILALFALTTSPPQPNTSSSPSHLHHHPISRNLLWTNPSPSLSHNPTPYTPRPTYQPSQRQALPLPTFPETRNRTTSFLDAQCRTDTTQS